MRRVTATLLSIVLLIWALPMAALLASSLIQGDLSSLLRGEAMPSLQQYRTLFENQQLLIRFRNSAVMTAGILALQLPLSVLGGFWLARRKGKAQAIMAICMVIAMLLPFQSVMVPAFRLSKWTGLYDSPWAVILLQAFSPLGTLTVWFFLRAIPEDNWEAALLDTSSQLRIFLRAILPQLLPALAVLALLCFAEAWNLVEQPLILLQDEGQLPASVSLNDLELNGVEPYAGAVVYSLPILLLYAVVGVILNKRQVDTQMV